MLKRWQHETSISDLSGNLSTSPTNESDFFDQFTNLVSRGPEDEIEERERVDEILALVSPGDQEILRLALLHDLNAQTLATVLQVSPGTACVRLHRALNRLRAVWKRQQDQ